MTPSSSESEDDDDGNNNVQNDEKESSSNDDIIVIDQPQCIEQSTVSNVYNYQHNEQQQNYNPCTRPTPQSFNTYNARSSIECYGCGEYGHIARNCPNRQNASRSIECYNCHQIGHYARNCPQQHTNDQNQQQSNGYGNSSDLLCGNNLTITLPEEISQSDFKRELEERYFVEIESMSQFHKLGDNHPFVICDRLQLKNISQAQRIFTLAQDAKLLIDGKCIVVKQWNGVDDPHQLQSVNDNIVYGTCDDIKMEDVQKRIIEIDDENDDDDDDESSKYSLSPIVYSKHEQSKGEELRDCDMSEDETSELCMITPAYEWIDKFPLFPDGHIMDTASWRGTQSSKSSKKQCKQPVDEWNIIQAELRRIDEANSAKYIQTFRQQGIETYADLKLLDKSDLKELINKMSARNRMWRFIKSLK